MTGVGLEAGDVFVSRAVERLQGKWKWQILYEMRAGPVGLGELSRRIPSLFLTAAYSI